MLKKKPFVRYDLEFKGNKPIVVKLNEEEKNWLYKAMLVLRQPKKSTALKQLAYVGYTKVVLDKNIKQILDYIFDNTRRNKRMGIQDASAEIDPSLSKSNTNEGV